MPFLTFTKDTRLPVSTMLDLQTLHTLADVATFGLGGMEITPALTATIEQLVCALVNPIRPLPQITKPRTIPLFPASYTRKEPS